MDQQAQKYLSPLSFLVNNDDALKAAARLAEHSEDGLRFCCESGQKLTVAEGRKRDEADAARKARFQQSMAALEARMLAAESHDAEMESATTQIAVDDEDADDFSEFENDDDADFVRSFAIGDEADDVENVEDEELLEIELV